MNEFGVAVMGAGIVGCSIAREIIRRDPGVSVTIIDRDTVGSGASRRSAGLHIPRGSTPEVRRMSAYSQHAYAEMLAADSDLPIHPLGMTVIADRSQTDAVSAAYLPEAALAQVWEVDGPVALPPGSSAWRGLGCHYADVYELTQRLAADLRPRVEVREGARVLEVDPRPNGVRLRLSTGAAVHADRAVLAPGPWHAEPAWQQLVAPVGARVKQVVALHIACRPGPADRVTVFHDEDAFLLPIVGRGYWLFSYTSQRWDVDPDDLDGGLGGADLAAARACLGRHAPQLLPYCTGARVFCDSYVPSGGPVVQHLDPDGRVVLAGACNGSGYRLAPAIATLTVDLLQLKPFSRSHA